MSWLKLLQTELTDIKNEDYAAPEEEIGEGETPMGEVCDDLKRIYTLAEKIAEAAARSAIDAKYAKNERSKKTAVQKAYKLKQKSTVLRNVFWICVHEQFGHWDRSIGIRRGYIAVILEESGPSIMDILRNI